MLRDNVGDMEYFDLRWSAALCILLFVVQLLWAFESVSQQTWFSAPQADKNLLFDTLYCLVTIVFVIFVTRKIVQQKVYSVSNEGNEITTAFQNVSAEDGTPTDADADRASYHESLVDKNIETIIRDNRYYLDKSMTLNKLASVLGTNRQYLSNYINQEKAMTFYDFINDFRLEEAKALLDAHDEEHSHSLEEICKMAGFNSYSTFLRSFAKKYGQTPSQYMKGKQR
jgi:AraC-like DNA-binding protein